MRLWHYLSGLSRVSKRVMRLRLGTLLSGLSPVLQLVIARETVNTISVGYCVSSTKVTARETVDTIACALRGLLGVKHVDVVHNHLQNASLDYIRNY